MYFEPSRWDESAALRIVEAMATRAPDGRRSWSRQPAALGYGALHTTAETAAQRPPLEREDGQLAITADARLDNRSQLLRDLRLRPSAGDAAVILAAYGRWGERCPERLVGDFSFAIWDERRTMLFCACDRFAVKPLYWYRSNRLGAVATEIKGLFALSDVPRRLNEARLADLLTIQFEDPRETVYVDVQRLPAAHSLSIDAAGTRLRRYWALHPERAWSGRSDREYEAAFRETFFEAVRTRTRTGGQLAAMLSGGMDSSSIVVAAREIGRVSGSPRPLHTLSARFAAIPGTDEREYIEAVLATGGLEPHFVHPEQLGPLDDWEGAAWRGDEPELYAAVSIGRALYGAAATIGARSVLDGLGGDFAVSLGGERLTELAAHGRWITLVREIRGLSRAGFGRPEALLRQFALAPFIPERLRQVSHTLKGRRLAVPNWARGIPFDPTFARRSQLHERYARFQVSESQQPRHPRWAHAKPISSALVQLALSSMDRMSGLFGVEPRYPFLDARLVELCLAIPADQKLRGGYNRDLVRRALNDLLPPEIRWRMGKGRPGGHTAHSLAATGGATLNGIMSRDPGPIAAYVDMQRMSELSRRYLSGAEPELWAPIYRVAATALWLEHAQTRLGLEL